MLKILKIKFKWNEEDRKALLETGDAVLVEFTGDRTWGCGLTLAKAAEAKVKSLQGENGVGKLLQQVREDLKKAK